MGKAPITRYTGLDVQPDPNLPSSVHALYAPKLTTAQSNLIKTTELRNGALIYNITTNTYQIYQSLNGVNAWFNLAASPITAATGVGLISGSPVILPTGTAAAVEVAGNAIEGFIYRNSTAPNIRVYNSGGWHTVTIV